MRYAKQNIENHRNWEENEIHRISWKTRFLMPKILKYGKCNKKHKNKAKTNKTKSGSMFKPASVAMFLQFIIASSYVLYIVLYMSQKIMEFED